MTRPAAAATPGLIIAAPASGCGKTTVTLALIRRLRDSGVAVSSCKVGPDYIDPAFHAAASGRACLNLDPWAMRRALLSATVAAAGAGADIVIAEGVMGLFDGAPDGTGSTADLAALVGWPVVLVVDVRGQAASAAALIRGFADHREDVAVAGVIFNRVGGEGHAAMLRRACAGLGAPLLGFVPRRRDLALPERHLGLVQAGERPDLERFLDRAAREIGSAVDLDRLAAAARPARLAPPEDAPLAAWPPLGQRIAVAGDDAFAFVYPGVLAGWRAAGAEILPFSPLADEAPAEDADAVYLPGGYPELHAGRLAGNRRFLEGLRRAAARGAVVYGECGGYMVLAEALTDAADRAHAMAGLLPVETSFAEPSLHLGYREVALMAGGPLGERGQVLRGHEFHYARQTGGRGAPPLFSCRDALGRELGPAGAVHGRVMGSFLHLIDSADATPADGRERAGRP